MAKLNEIQLNNIKEVGTLMLATASKDGKPHCTIVEPSRYYEDRIIIPIVQMETSKKNIMENNQIFIHVFKEDKNDPEWSTQYKLDCTALIETSGKLFEEIKNYEETEVLPEGFYVNGIIIAYIDNCREYVG
jgi:hypothetical protein